MNLSKTRTIFLVDMNAFFIGCEMTRSPALKEGPAAVSGDPERRTGIILAANYPARACGVRTAMTVHQALKLCPEMKLVPPDHSFYSQKSQEVMELLSGYSPVVEQNSIDEAWLDMTGTEGLFGTPREAATLIQEEIRTSLDLWCSIGIANNKFCAKMASELKKPLGITELYEEDVTAKLWPLPVREMHGVGAKTAEKLNSIGITTIGQLAHTDEALLFRMFGKAGREIHLHANGRDDSPLTPRAATDVKSIGRSVTLPADLSDLAEAKRVLLALSDDIGRRARRLGKKGHTLQITLKYADFQVATRQMPVPETSTTQEIYEAGCQLLSQHWNPSRPVRLLGISLNGFEGSQTWQAAEESVQLSFFDPAAADHASTPDHHSTNSEKEQRIDQAMDQIREKLGSNLITRGSLIRK